MEINTSAPRKRKDGAWPDVRDQVRMLRLTTDDEGEQRGLAALTWLITHGVRAADLPQFAVVCLGVAALDPDLPAAGRARLKKLEEDFRVAFPDLMREGLVAHLLEEIEQRAPGFKRETLGRFVQWEPFCPVCCCPAAPRNDGDDDTWMRCANGHEFSKTRTVWSEAGAEPAPRGFVDIVMTRPPGPESDFVEAEDPQGRGVKIGQWIQRPNGTWALRIPYDTQQLERAAHGDEVGATCGRGGCAGVLEETADGDGCSCHVAPPCEYCTSTRPHCPACGWDMGEPK